MKAPLRSHRRIGGSRLVSFLAVTFGLFDLLVRAHAADRDSVATSASSEWPFLFLPASSPTTLLSSLFHAEKEAQGEGRHLKASGSPADNSSVNSDKGSGESASANLSPQSGPTMTTTTAASPDDKADPPPEAAEPGLPAHHPLYRMPSRIVATDAQAFAFPFWKQPAPKPALPPSPPNVLNAPASISSSPAFMAWFGTPGSRGNQSDSTSPSEELSESLQTTIVGGGGGQGSTDGSMPPGLQREWFGTRQPYNKESFPSFFSWIWKGGSPDNAETSLSSLVSQKDNQSQTALKNAAHENSSFPWGLWRSKDVALPEQLRQRAALLSAFASTWWFGSCSSSSSSSPVDSVVDGVKKASHKTGEAFREASRAISESSPGGFSSEVPAGPALTQGQQLLSPAIAAVKAAAWWFSEREKEIEDAAKDVLSRSSTNGSSSSMSSLLQQHQQTWFFGESENGDNKETIHQTAEVDEDPSMKKQLLSSLQNAAAWFGHQKNTLQNLDVSKASSWFSGLQALRETGAAESYLWSGSEHDDAVASLSPQKENFERSPKTEETSKKHFFPACWFQQWFWGGETTENDDSGKVDRHTKEKKTKKLALFDPAQIFAIPTKTAIWWSQQEARAPEAVTFFWSLRPSSEKESGLSSDDHRNLHEANGPLRRLSESDKASDVVFSDLLASPPPPPAASAAAAAAASWLWSQKASTADREGGEDKGRVISSSSSPSSFSPSPLESTLAWFWEKQKEDAEKEMSTWFGRKDLPGTAQQDTTTKPSSSSSSSSPQSWLFGRAHNAQTNVGDSLKESLADWFGQWTEAAKSNAKDAVTEVQDKALNKLNEKTAGVQKKASKAAKAGFSAWFWGSSDPVKNTVQTGKAVVKSLTEDDKKKKEEEEEGGGSTEKKSHSLAGQLKSLVFGDGKNKDQDAKKEEVSSSETVSPSPTAASAWWQGPFSTQEGKEGVDPSSMASSWFTRGAGGQSTPKGGEGPIGNLSNASASSFTGSWVGTPSKNSPSYGDEKSRSVASKVASWFEREKKEEKPSSPWNFFSGDHHQGAFFGSSQDSSDISKESLGKSLSGWSWGRSSHGHDDLKEEKDSKESHSHSSSWFPTLNYSHKETRAASSSPSSSALPHASEGGKTSQENGVTSTGKYTQEEGKMTDRQGQSHLDGERVRSPQAGSSSPTTKLPQDVVAGDSSQPGGGLMQAWNWNGGYGGYSGGGQSHPVPEEGPTVRRSGSLWGAAGVSSINNGVPMISSSSASASLFDWGSEEEKKKKEEPLSSSSSSLFEKMSHAMTSRIHEEKVSSSETSSGANIPTQLIAKHAAQAAGWLGMSGDETPHPIRAPGLKRGSYWWEWQANSDGTTSVTTTPPYTRHVHLDCDPTPPFRDCVMKCQSKPSNGAMNAVAEEERRRRTGEPAALGSYEYSNLRSCYMTCRQKWIDADLPGCLRQDGTKVEGIPPVEAFRTTTTTPPATTLPRPRAHTSYPQGSPWEIQDEKKNKESSSFWSRMTGRKTSEEKPIETNTPEEQKGFFSIFRGSSDTTTTTLSPSSEEESHGLSKLLGILKGGGRKTQETPSQSTEGSSASRFPFSLLGGTSGDGNHSKTSSGPDHHNSSSSSSLFSGWSSATTGETYLSGHDLLSPLASQPSSSEDIQDRLHHEDEKKTKEKDLPSVSSFGVSLWPSSSSFSKTSEETPDKEGVVSSEESQKQQQISFPFNLLSKESQEATATPPNLTKDHLSTEMKEQNALQMEKNVAEEKKAEGEGGGWWMMMGMPGRAATSSLLSSSTDDHNDSLIDKTIKAVKDGVSNNRSSEDGGVVFGEDTKKSIEAVKEAAEEAGKETTHAILNWWPVLLLIVGIGLLVISLVGRRFGQWEGMAGSGDLERGEYAGAPAFRSMDSSQKSRSSVHTMQSRGASNNYDDHKQPLISNEGE